VDAIFEGHTHRCYSFLDNNVPHVQTYANGSDIQHVQFKVSPNTGKLIFDHYNDITIETITSLEDEPMATKVYDHYESEVAVVKNEVIYTSSSQISKNELAKFAVKSLYDFYAERDQDDERPLVGAVINSGGVRQVLPAGNITYGDLLAALPFENDNVEVAMTLTNAETFSNNYVGYMTDVSSLSSSSEVRMITLSYLSDGPYVGQYSFTELSRDGVNFLKDIVAQAFRDGKYGG
jgi:2',3'-cyclic-nucleotide 2'-phosphodiesterase (5'-nucleotidase family)